MSEPAWVALGAQPVDYEGTYNAGTQYVPGDVVRYQGVDYICVNPALGQAPPASVVPITPPTIPVVTTLPTSPFDGQEVILTDSLTVPTWAWRLRYSGAITDAYKWVFVGGSPVRAFEAIAVDTTASYAAMGPILTLPRAGIYDLLHTSVERSGAGGPHSFQFWTWSPTAAIAGAREHSQDTQAGNSYWVISHRDRVTIPTVAQVVVAFKHWGNGGNVKDRLYEAIPVRLA